MITFIIGMIVVGLVVGALARLLMPGRDPMGIGGTILLGIVGAFIAGWLLPRIGIVIGGGMVASIINATIGAVVLLVITGVTIVLPVPWIEKL